MTTVEQQLSELLKRSVPEPPVELSADRVTVRHAGRDRGSWLMPALAAAAVVLVAGAGVGLNAALRASPAAPAVSSAGGQVTPAETTAAHAPGAPAEAPAGFDPLVLPVNFGWLPAGFTENEPQTGEYSGIGGQVTVTKTQASFGAYAADGRGFTVSVAVRGAEPRPGITSMAADGLLGATGATTVTGPAPDVNGRPARWLADGLEWEYANGGWATLLADGGTAAQGALLEKVASNLTWTPQSFVFPYRFTQALPSGWAVSEVTGEFVNGRLTSVQTNLVPKAAPNTKDPLTIQAFTAGNTAGCENFNFSGTTFATYHGVTWAIQADHSGATACAGARMTKKNTGSVGMAFEQDTVAYLPTPLGPPGVKVLLPSFQFLGTNPASWTTSPFAA